MLSFDITDRNIRIIKGVESGFTYHLNVVCASGDLAIYTANGFAADAMKIIPKNPTEAKSFNAVLRIFRALSYISRAILCEVSLATAAESPVTLRA